MWICYFKNLLNGKEFEKVFYDQQEMNTFLTKCRYSKKIRFIGRQDVWA